MRTTNETWLMSDKIGTSWILWKTMGTPMNKSLWKNKQMNIMFRQTKVSQLNEVVHVMDGMNITKPTK